MRLIGGFMQIVTSKNDPHRAKWHSHLSYFILFIIFNLIKHPSSLEVTHWCIHQQFVDRRERAINNARWYKHDQRNWYSAAKIGAFPNLQKVLWMNNSQSAIIASFPVSQQNVALVTRKQNSKKKKEVQGELDHQKLQFGYSFSSLLHRYICSIKPVFTLRRPTLNSQPLQSGTSHPVK